ncbi:MAG TPA: hypothetical protein HPP77_03305, partial [Candidatus Hydrogenedentes bacterium]|nr:hypothetical protein [Candidatus Hydrogenedentota bacterium]
YKYVTVPDLPTWGDSVFDRATYTDVVDVDNDGAHNDGTVEDLVLSTMAMLPEADYASATKAWDRIVELEIASLTAIAAADDIYAWVLKGGIFPNYPEHDGIDNDGDNTVLTTDRVDNDGDWDDTDALDGADNDGDGQTDEYDEARVDEPGEGVDEGRWRRDVDRAAPPWPFPGAFDWMSVWHRLYLGDPTLPYNPAQQLNLGAGLDPADPYYRPYLGKGFDPANPSDPFDPPEWKAFVERRFFPGDNVIVTLCEGPAAGGRIVDRVTYTEQDVVNWVIDEEFSVYLDGDAFPDREPLDLSYPTFWPDNSMEFDFYKSLERKHPHYPGDRFGFQNRWQATDGNYDDWYHTSLYEDGVRPGASPLRKNMAQDIFELGDFDLAVPLPGPDHTPLWTFDRAWLRNRTLASTGNLITTSLMALKQSFEVYTIVPGVAGYYPGTQEVPQVLVGQNLRDLRAVVSAGATGPLVLTAAQADMYPLDPPVETPVGGPPPLGILDDPTLIQWDLATNTPPTAWAPVFLYSLDPGGNEVPGVTQTLDGLWLAVDDDLYRDFVHIPDGVPAPPPDDEDYPVQLNFLLNGPVLPAELTETDLWNRWRLDRRTVNYVCAGIGSEALFVWDGDEGVENGEYAVFLVLAEDYDMLAEAHELSGDTLLSAFGEAFLAAAGATGPQDMIADIEMFTDRDADTVCWYDAPADGGNGNGFPDADEFENAGPDGIPGNGDDERFDSLGILPNMRPRDDGLLYYGIIRVENNFLALRIVNRTPDGRLLRFARVILAPRSVTPGRINVNTAETQIIEVAGDDELSNPLLGIPGFFAYVDPDTGHMSYEYRVTDDDQGNVWLADAPGPYAGADPPLAPVNAQKLAEAGHNRVWRVLGLRPHHYDGRYYLFTADLTDDAVGADLGIGTVYPLSPLADEIARFDEKAWRFSRISNLITTRSDVFEILVTGQTGYGVDENGDGIINYRDDNEFVVTAEKKTRTIYER